MADKKKKYIVTELGITWDGVKKIIGSELMLTDRQAKSLTGKIATPANAVKQTDKVAEAAGAAVAEAEKVAAEQTEALEAANKRIAELEAAAKAPAKAPGAK